ncbi:MAG: hypothetical protein HY235_27020 [Acidobacteria bacterium]|nr:hypothetical protein [Acidobacteriota bacterium]
MAIRHLPSAICYPIERIFQKGAYTREELLGEVRRLVLAYAPRSVRR